ncbi:hypothetical protein PMIN01_05906 [Paraphaeosphaeria minitans]|uniref:Uncharacterized protein n=1 Tax=Paraphaeosphaeria minitans TaxID=565426 RepID=A0A9P6GIW8_9PLEO|nr:hypothetical protein PMIN01_05906 [Paraphaeosphaeria minitans]
MVPSYNVSTFTTTTTTTTTTTCRPTLGDDAILPRLPLLPTLPRSPPSPSLPTLATRCTTSLLLCHPAQPFPRRAAAIPNNDAATESANAPSRPPCGHPALTRWGPIPTSTAIHSYWASKTWGTGWRELTRPLVSHGGPPSLLCSYDLPVPVDNRHAARGCSLHAKENKSDAAARQRTLTDTGRRMHCAGSRLTSLSTLDQNVCIHIRTLPLTKRRRRTQPCPFYH